MKIHARKSSLFVRIIFHSREFYWWLRSWYEFILAPNCFLIPLCLLNKMIREFYTSYIERNEGTFSDIYGMKIESADRYVSREQQKFCQSHKVEKYHGDKHPDEISQHLVLVQSLLLYYSRAKGDETGSLGERIFSKELNSG